MNEICKSNSAASLHFGGEEGVHWRRDELFGFPRPSDVDYVVAVASGLLVDH